MNQLSERDLEQHVKILGWLHIASAALLLVVAGFVFFLLTGIGAASGEPEALRILGVTGTAVAMLLTAIGLPGLAAGYGLLKHQAWARILAIIVGIFNLVNVPIGTAIGIYTIFVLMQDSATEYFATPTAA